MARELRKDIKILPAAGRITIEDLAKVLNTNPNSVIEGLGKNGVKIKKYSKYHSAWLVNIEEL